MPRLGGTVDRGYGAAHKRERNKWKRLVARGGVDCWRCGEPIDPHAEWDLGHDDDDRTQYRGPEHVDCNRSAGGRRAHGRTDTTVTSREW